MLHGYAIRHVPVSLRLLRLEPDIYEEYNILLCKQIFGMHE